MRQRLFGSRKRKAVLSALLTMVVCATAGVAAWTLTSGPAPLKGQAGTLVTPTFALASSAVTPVFPGGAAGSLDGKATNPNNATVHVTAVTPLTVSNVDVLSLDTSNCPSANFVVDRPTLQTQLAALTLAPNATAVPMPFPGVLTLAANAPMSCQGVAVTVTIAANVLTWSTP